MDRVSFLTKSSKEKAPLVENINLDEINEKIFLQE
jgi:hypothetical protein